jgi:hypothetical protein
VPRSDPVGRIEISGRPPLDAVAHLRLLEKTGVRLALGIALSHLVGGVFTAGGLHAGGVGGGPGSSTGSDTSGGPRRSARQVIEERLRAIILVERVVLRSASRHSRTERGSPARPILGCSLAGSVEHFDRVASEAVVIRGDAEREAEEPEARRGLFIVGRRPCEAFRNSSCTRFSRSGPPRGFTLLIGTARADPSLEIRADSDRAHRVDRAHASSALRLTLRAGLLPEGARHPITRLARRRA